MNTLRKGDDSGSCMEFTWSDQQSLFGYLLGFGGYVEVLEPKELRKEFIRHVHNICRKYE